MRKKMIKKHIAGFVATSMVLSMLAPQATVFASTRQNIKFDLGVYTTLEGMQLEDLVFDGNTISVKDKYPGFPVDTGANGQDASSVDPVNALELPWWNVDWQAFNAAAAASTTGMPTSPAKPAPTWNNKTFNFPGYTLAGWVESTGVDENKINKISQYFPYAVTTYIAKYKSDGTLYKFTTKYEAAQGSSAPVSASDTKTVNKKVLGVYQAPVLNVPGYIGTIADSDVKIFEPGTTTPVAPAKPYTYYGWNKVDNKYFSGQIFNKDMEVTFKYAVDTSKTFSVETKNKVLDADGNISNTTSKRYTFNAEADVTSVGPLASLITPQNGATNARYVLVTADGGSSKPNEKAPVITAGTTADNDKHIVAYSGAFDANHKLTGKMPNQNMVVEYVYKPNPNYKLNVTVRYKDENGNSLTADVIEASGESLQETQDHAIVYELNPNTSTQAPLPDLSAKGYTAPSFRISANALNAGQVSIAANKLNIAMAQATYEVTVVYPKDPAKWENILIDNAGNLVLRNTGDTEEYDPQAEPITVEKNAAGKLVLSDAVIAQLPLIKPDTGFEIDGFYDGNTKVVNADRTAVTANYQLGSTTVGSSTTYKLIAKVTKNNNWRNYTFTYDGGGHGFMSDYPKTVSLYPLTANGDPKTIEWNTLDPNSGSLAVEFSGLIPAPMADPGYEIKWYDPNGDALQNDTDILTYPAGTTFTAKAVSTAPLSLNQAPFTGEINTTTGVAELKLAAADINPDPSVWYVVADENGNVIKKVRASELTAAGGAITGTGIIPDTNYKIYEVAPTVAVGNNINTIPAGQISTPAEVRTPVAVEPEVREDPNGNNMNVAIIEPVTPGMEYAVVTDDGTTVAVPWTRPMGTRLELTGLEPDKNYRLVVRPQGSSDLETGRVPGLPFRSIAQSGANKIVLVNPENIEVLQPAGLNLDEVPVNTRVRLKARPIDANGDGFKMGLSGWQILTGTPVNPQSDGTTIYEFTMPRGVVTIKARYGSSSVVWSPASSSDAIGAGNGVNVVEPDAITAAGEYRISVERKEASPSDARAIGDTQTNRFTALYQIIVKVQRKDPSSIWVDYNDPNLDLDTYVGTGILSRDTREYKLFSMAGGTPSEEAGAVDAVNNDSYTGTFRYAFKNGARYVFGYTQPDTFNVRIKNSRNNLSIANFRVGTMNSLSDYRDRYQSALEAHNNEVDINGITWKYVGLSTDRNSYQAYDENRLITSDEVIYAYYTDDRVERAEAETRLRNLIDAANDLSFKDQIQALISAATALVNQITPRKASTAELTDMFNTLSAEIDRLNNANGGGGRSYGGGGCGGGGGRSGGRGVVNQSQNTNRSTNPISNYTTYSVGTDGSWKLVDASKHVWKFESGNGVAVTGWANLAYNYNGERRVETYHFRADGVMDSGWFKDESGRWFYMSEEHDGFFGRLVRGWYKSAADNRWYYLSTVDGHMITGWNKVSDVWYYLSPQNTEAPTWRYNEAQAKWEFIGNDVRPLGSMYQNERTPDNYFVNESGAWVEGR